MQSTIQGDWIFYGAVGFSGNGTLTLPSGIVTNANLVAYANLDISKLRHRVDETLSQGSATTAAAQSNPIYVAKAAGTITGLEVGAVVANIGAAACTVDLKKNGTSVLTGGTPVSLTNATAAYATVAASITTAAYAAGDVFELIITATAGGGTLAKGLFVKFEADEANQ